MDYLGNALAAGRMCLCTGAGFSCAAVDPSGRPIPDGRTLAREIWPLCFPDEPWDEHSSLEDLFCVALAEQRDALAALLKARLTVDPASLPSWYANWFGLPWRRAYTLNIDNLASATTLRFPFMRPLREISALMPAGPRGASEPPGPPEPPGFPVRPVHSPPSQPPVLPPRGAVMNAERTLELIHLNGMLVDGPENVTFSTTQYGARLASSDPFYQNLAQDLGHYAFVFVGTRLEEAPFWQYLAAQRAQSLPRSIAVAPHLSRARRRLFEGLNISWLPQTAESFARGTLAEIAQAMGAIPVPHPDTR